MFDDLAISVLAVCVTVIICFALWLRFEKQKLPQKKGSGL